MWLCYCQLCSFWFFWQGLALSKLTVSCVAQHAGPAISLHSLILSNQHTVSVFHNVDFFPRDLSQHCLQWYRVVAVIASNKRLVRVAHNILDALLFLKTDAFISFHLYPELSDLASICHKHHAKAFMRCICLVDWFVLPSCCQLDYYHHSSMASFNLFHASRIMSYSASQIHMW